MAMKACINNNNGYVVEALITCEDGLERYRPIINFGDRQGDAIEFVAYDFEKFNYATITARSKSYKDSDKYKRVGPCKYVKL